MNTSVITTAVRTRTKWWFRYVIIGIILLVSEANVVAQIARTLHTLPEDISIGNLYGSSKTGKVYGIGTRQVYDNLLQDFITRLSVVEFLDDRITEYPISKQEGTKTIYCEGSSVMLKDFVIAMDGTLWVATMEELWSYDGAVWRTHKLNLNSDLQTYYDKIVVNNDNTISVKVLLGQNDIGGLGYVISKIGLYRYDGTTPSLIYEKPFGNKQGDYAFELGTSRAFYSSSVNNNHFICYDIQSFQQKKNEHILFSGGQGNFQKEVIPKSSTKDIRFPGYMGMYVSPQGDTWINCDGWFTSSDTTTTVANVSGGLWHRSPEGAWKIYGYDELRMNPNITKGQDLFSMRHLNIDPNSGAWFTSINPNIGVIHVSHGGTMHKMTRDFYRTRLSLIPDAYRRDTVDFNQKYLRAIFCLDDTTLIPGIDRLAFDSAGTAYFNAYPLGIVRIKGLRNAFGTSSVSQTDTPIQTISMIPQPAQGYVQLRGLVGNADVELYSLVGTKVKEWHNIGANEPLPIDAMTNGVYMVRITHSGRTTNLPLVILR